MWNKNALPLLFFTFNVLFKYPTGVFVLIFVTWKEMLKLTEKTIPSLDRLSSLDLGPPIQLVLNVGEHLKKPILTHR